MIWRYHMLISVVIVDLEYQKPRMHLTYACIDRCK